MFTNCILFHFDLSRLLIKVIVKHIANVLNIFSEQQRMIKLNEKNEQKLKQAHEEIRQMKQAKVRLIRQMKEDADKVRTWKIQKEKEVNQLKQTERKQQVKLAKMETVYNKQLNVAKRKLEEANARTQRLKDVMDKQKANKKSTGMNAFFYFCIFYVISYFSSFSAQLENKALLVLPNV